MAFQLHNGMGSAFFTTNTWGTTPTTTTTTTTSNNNSGAGSGNSGVRSRPGTSSGDPQAQTQSSKNSTATTPKVLTKDRDRKPSFGRRASFTSPTKPKRRASLASIAAGDHHSHIKTDASTPPAIPDFALAQAAAAKLSRETEVAVVSPTAFPTDFLYNKPTTTTTTRTTGGSRNVSAPAAAMNGHYSSATSPPTVQTGPGNPVESSSFSVHQHIHELANKRISTLDYLRKAHEGRIYWFNTLMFDKPDLARMPYFDNRKLARRATNYLLLGLSLPAVIDFSSSTPLEFLRSLNMLLAEFESYQQIHTENGTSTSSTLSRAARIPSMFRRGPGGRGRRQSGAGTGGDGGADAGSGGASLYNNSNSSGGGNMMGGNMMGGNPSGGGGGAADGSAAMSLTAAGSVINFGLGGEGHDLLPGEEYAHLLTPNLPFDPDFFETFATLCDVLIDCYARLVGLLPTARDCGPGVAELFAKADARVRKLIVQGVVKEFEDAARAGVKQEMTNVGKVVLSGLM